jgi:electron transfer flavoprotein beta subunit
MAAKKKPLEVKALADVVPGAALTSRVTKYERPQARSAGVRVKDAAELLDKLIDTAKVL